ncbi:protein sel-1 homolog 3 [Halichoeres trimaculatus]|uniref:protein sel-1 homolog 3 n=1 Tax=Halichoeres trimaculatus TaxID=147232 RepID=UPI003D9F7628
MSCGKVIKPAQGQGHCLSQTISTPSAQPAESQPDNFIEFHSAPDGVVDGSVVRVRYQCSRPCQLTVEVVVSTLRKTDSVVLRKKWISSAPRVYRIHRVLLTLPPSILYQQDFFNRRVLDTQNVTVRAWLDHLNDSTTGTYQGAVLRVYKMLKTTPLSERPAKPPTGCPSWSAHQMWQISRNRIHQCQHESDIIDMLTFPLASTGEHFGVIRRFHPFIDRSLERKRRHAVTKPSVTLSVWIYLLKWCHTKLCGIIHHVDERDSFASVLMLLTDTGDVMIQARMTTGEDDAFRAVMAMPLRKWIRLDCYIEDSKVLLNARWDLNRHNVHYEFKAGVLFNDTDGYFVIGGGRYMQGLHGYIGPVRYYRFGTKVVENQLQPISLLKELDKTHQECQEVKEFTKAYLREITKSRPKPSIKKGNTPFIQLWRQPPNKICNQTWAVEQQLKHSNLFHFLKSEEKKTRGGGSLSMKNLRSVLFEHSQKTMFTRNQTNNTITFNSTSLLREASCLGNHRASLLLATIHLSGLGNSVDQEKGHVYSLIGAAGDDRLALMHAGYKHSQGIDGFPKDLDLAYSYYSNMGAQSSADINRIFERKQNVLHHVYLNNPEDLNRLNHEKNDGYHYAKFKAESGDAESQRNLAVMLYRGDNGIAKDIESAMRWFERSAMQMKDAAAMYDYSIILMKGEGAKKNDTRGFQLMQKAAEMGSIRALNGLGWYHWNVLEDHKSAVKYFEQAAHKGNEDAIYNLGIFYLYGKHPDKPWKNETAAFQQFLNASQYGHIAALVEVAWYSSTGNLGGVSQDVQRAVIILKKVCEQNGHLGFMISEALQAYLQGSRQEAFVKYILAAETGLGLAQSNAAHLCEELNFTPDCKWRYLNYSILNYDPHPAALLKMGDHYYYPPSSTRADSLSLVGRAVSMYGRAAVAGSPQGMFNLVVLVKEGHTLPTEVYRFFNLSRYDEQHIVVEKILRRCVAAEHEDSVTPCSLALLGVQMGKALSRMTQSRAQLVLAYASLLSLLVIIVILSLQSCLGQRVHSQGVRVRTSSTSQDGANGSREQNANMGEALRAERTLCCIALKAEQCLRQMGDVVVTVSGMCLCVFWTTLLYHLL